MFNLSIEKVSLYFTETDQHSVTSGVGNGVGVVEGGMKEAGLREIGTLGEITGDDDKTDNVEKDY